MSRQSVADPAATSLLVSKLIGYNPYQIVKFVAENMDDIRIAATNIGIINNAVVTVTAARDVVIAARDSIIPIQSQILALMDDVTLDANRAMQARDQAEDYAYLLSTTASGFYYTSLAEGAANEAEGNAYFVIDAESRAYWGVVQDGVGVKTAELITVAIGGASVLEAKGYRDQAAGYATSAATAVDTVEGIAEELNEKLEDIVTADDLASTDLGKGVDLLSGVAYQAESLARVKAVVTSRYKTAFLYEEGKVGTWAWRTGDYSTLVTADTAGGMYLAADGISPSVGAWVRILGDDQFVRPEWFGAKGDGVSNDTVALQLALDLGVRVQLSAATYLTTAPIYMRRTGATIQGVGRDVSKITGGGNPTGSPRCVIYVDGNNDMKIDSVWLHAENIPGGVVDGCIGSLHEDVERLTITNNKFTTNTSKSINGIKAVLDNAASGWNNVTIANNLFYQIGRMGIEFQNHNDDVFAYRYRNIKITDNEFYQCGMNGSGTGMSLSLSGKGMNILVENNDFRESRGPSIEVIGPDYSSFIDNIIRDSAGSRPIQVANSRLMTGLIFARNKVFGGNPLDCYFASTIDCDIFDNLFDLRTATGNSSYVRLVRQTAGARGMQFHGNKVYTKSGNAVFLDSLPHCRIYDNDIDNTAASSNSAPLSLYVATATDLFGVVENNRLYRSSTSGTTISTPGGATNILQKDNVYVTTSGMPTMLAPGGAQTATATYNPPSIPPGGSVTTTMTVNNALLGETLIPSFSLDLQGLIMSAHVSAADIVSVTFFNPATNESGTARTAVDLGSGTIRIRRYRASS